MRGLLSVFVRSNFRGWGRLPNLISRPVRSATGVARTSSSSSFLTWVSWGPNAMDPLSCEEDELLRFEDSLKSDSPFGSAESFDDSSIRSDSFDEDSPCCSDSMRANSSSPDFRVTRGRSLFGIDLEEFIGFPLLRRTLIRRPPELSSEGWQGMYLQHAPHRQYQ